MHDRASSTTERVSVSSSSTQANDQSFSPQPSSDGRYIAYLSYANNLTPENADWWYPDIFLFDRVNRTTELITLSTEGVQANLDSGTPRISGDGRFVSFSSYAPELILNENGLGFNDVFIRDRAPQ